MLRTPRPNRCWIGGVCIEWPTLAPAVLLITTEKVDVDEPRLQVVWAMVDRHSYSHPSGKRRVPTLDLRLIDLSASQRTKDDPPSPILSGHGTPSTSANPPNDLQYPTWPAIRPRRAWTTLSTFHYHCWCRWAWAPALGPILE